MTAKNFARISTISVTIFAVKGVMAASNASTTRPAFSNYARQLGFEPNRGQTDKRVDFLAHGTGYSLFLSHADAVIVVRHGVQSKSGSPNQERAVSSAAFRMSAVGGNSSAPLDALGQLPGKSNYFVGSVAERWHTDIPNYAKVRYRDVYPGIDIIYYGNENQLEYDFIVGPGANPGAIALEFHGAGKAELDDRGNLVMHTSAGDMRWHKPLAYQEVNGNRRLVGCGYVRTSTQRLRFRLDTYDRTKPLIIDPVLEYSTYLGGSASDQGSGIVVDAHGNAYVTGDTSSTDFPAKDAFHHHLKGFGDAFVSKFDTAGNLIYSTYLGGSDTDYGVSIAVDAYGNAYITGGTSSNDFPTKNAFQHSLKAQPNAFVTKLCPTGNSLVYSSYLGGSVGEDGSGIAWTPMVAHT